MPVPGKVSKSSTASLPAASAATRMSGSGFSPGMAGIFIAGVSATMSVPLRMNFVAISPLPFPGMSTMAQSGASPPASITNVWAKGIIRASKS